jgi:glycosyltransferase involved in cell wall biosynthesis
MSTLAQRKGATRKTATSDSVEGRSVMGMRLLVATDAWEPQVNGVVKTMRRTIDEIRGRGGVVDIIEPGLFPRFPLPGYPEIPIALPPPDKIGRLIAAFEPTHVHISTEGPIGWTVRRHCLRSGRPFTTSYHTRFPEYLRERLPIPIGWTYAMARRFHGRAQATMVATASIETELRDRGFRNLHRWSRGVDLTRFRPDAASLEFAALPKPIFLTVGRLAKEKNLPALLSLDLTGTKVVVGDGPERGALARQFPETVFLGARDHAQLAGLYAAADVFVFPSLTDTFGLVLIEALASGLPVAAFPVAGPLDIVADTAVGVLSHDLQAASLAALAIDRGGCRLHARNFTWEMATDQFLRGLNAAPNTRHS